MRSERSRYRRPMQCWVTESQEQAVKRLQDLWGLSRCGVARCLLEHVQVDGDVVTVRVEGQPDVHVFDERIHGGGWGKKKAVWPGPEGRT